MNKILNYELFIFDFDGTLMDTEEYHNKSWNKALSQYTKNDIQINMQDYQKYFHSLDNTYSKNYLNICFNVIDYDKIYKIKQQYYEEYVKSKKINFIKGAEDFLKLLIENKKKYVIVSNTSNKFMDIYKEKYPILNNAEKIYTKEIFINKKPNPECYLRISNEYKNISKIGFEDSLVGIHALYQVQDITPIFIVDKNYYYYEYIQNQYKNISLLTDFNFNELNINKINNENTLFIDKILNNNITEINKNFLNMKHIISQITILLNNINYTNHIYLSGMGKSGYICKKSASTWQSLCINCSYIDLPNLPHGDFGIFRENDILILISNNGNTDEIIYILKYIKNNLKKKINTISIVANKNSEMEKLSNFTYILENIQESDNINMTPSTSSLIFMMLLDSIAINLKKNITKDEFQKYHPAGSLGKK
jgi:D-arabinose 5-phosphate isomerase GutQ/beta-phosphoglucomutase-like phosphatase (HAD superfamily)